MKQKVFRLTLVTLDTKINTYLNEVLGPVKILLPVSVLFIVCSEYMKN